ncbi:DUF4190 domain-containing protein [Bifidobacterium sp. ESL0769]|uniref:DUF4190 domain-containing protein n=1 Tax=Bifidobacterium sp. ESL0769 TaxID=2983229 RepID=UPI0023F7C384|nr:DUF4190 domain-containing protein [Bifidobacterium sp. ESL0769]WEV67908.1 DUF4190 domain-containing protein [Bifidobacterium sp. ESL0769]
MNNDDFNANPPTQPNQFNYQYGDAGQQTNPQPQFQDAGMNPQMPDYQAYGQVPPAVPTMPPTGPTGPGAVPPVTLQGYYAPAPEQKWNTMCIVGFILSFFMPLIGLVLSVVALVQINHSGEKSKPMAIAGLVIGAISTILSIVFVIIFFSAFGYAVHHLDTDDSDCHGSDCQSDPYDDEGDDPDDDNEDTDYAYYLYDFAQESNIADVTALSNAA